MMRQRIRSGNTLTDMSSILVFLVLALTLEFTPMGRDKSDAASGNGVTLGIELSPCWFWVITQFCHSLQNPLMRSAGFTFAYSSCSEMGLCPAHATWGTKKSSTRSEWLIRRSCNAALDAGMKVRFEA